MSKKEKLNLQIMRNGRLQNYLIFYFKTACNFRLFENNLAQVIV